MAKENCCSEALENLSFCFLVRHDEQAREESNASLKEQQTEERDHDDVAERIFRCTYTPPPGEEGREGGRGRTLLFKSSRKKRLRGKRSLSSLKGDTQVKDEEQKERNTGEEKEGEEERRSEEGREEAERPKMSSPQEQEEQQERSPALSQQTKAKGVRRPRYSLVYLHPHPKGLLASLPLPRDFSSGRWKASEVLHALWDDQSDSAFGEMTTETREIQEEKEDETGDRKRNEGKSQGSDDKEERECSLCRREGSDKRKEDERRKEAFHEENGVTHHSTDACENSQAQRIHTRSNGATEIQRQDEKSQGDFNGNIDEEKPTSPPGSPKIPPLSLGSSSSSSSSLLPRSPSSSSACLSCALLPLRQGNDKRRDEALRQRLVAVGALSAEVAKKLEDIPPHAWRRPIEDMLAVCMNICVGVGMCMYLDRYVCVCVRMHVCMYTGGRGREVTQLEKEKKRGAVK